MTRDEIIKLAREAGLMSEAPIGSTWSAPLPSADYLERLERFAALVAADEDAEMKCAVKNCTNHSHQGRFIGLLCGPCHAFIAGDRDGQHSQAYRNARHGIDKAVKAERDATLQLCKELEESEAAPWQIIEAIQARSGGDCTPRGIS